MTSQAFAAVPVDWQVLVTGQTDPAAAQKTAAGWSAVRGSS